MTHERVCEIHNQIYGSALPMCICTVNVREQAIQDCIARIELLRDENPMYDVPLWQAIVELRSILERE